MKPQKSQSSQSLQLQAADYERRAKELDARERLLQRRQEELVSLNTKEKESLRRLGVNKQRVQDEIAERKKYLAEQEKVIADAIDEGNATLRGIGYEIQAEQQRRDDLRNEIAQLETMRTNAAFKKVQADMELQRLQAELQGKQHVNKIAK